MPYPQTSEQMPLEQMFCMYVAGFVIGLFLHFNQFNTIYRFIMLFLALFQGIATAILDYEIRQEEILTDRYIHFRHQFDRLLIALNISILLGLMSPELFYIFMYF